MKRILLIAALGIVLTACQKENQNIDVLNAQMSGKYYVLKSDIFNRGAKQPVNPLYIKSVYFNQVEQRPYAKAAARIDWNNFDPATPANKIEVNYGLKLNDTVTHIWDIPVEDFK